MRGSHANYVGETAAIAVLAVDDDLTFETDVATVTEDTPFGAAGPAWVTLTLTPAEGGMAIE